MGEIRPQATLGGDLAAPVVDLGAVSYSDHMRLIRETNDQLPDRGEKQ
jgi:hypothetical protein